MESLLIRSYYRCRLVDNWLLALMLGICDQAQNRVLVPKLNVSYL